MYRQYPELSAAEAVQHIDHGMTVAVSGFTAAGSIKACGRALAARATSEHQAGRPFAISLLTGASTGDSVDRALAEANALHMRSPYQSDPLERKRINNGEILFFDMHLSHVPQYVSYGFYGPIHVAIIEATMISPEGFVYLTTSSGASPDFLASAEKVIIEVNEFHTPRLREIHDVVITPRPPHRREIPIYRPLDRIGTPYAWVDPAKIIGVVRTNEPDEAGSPAPYDDVHRAIGEHVVDFLAAEMKAGRIPAGFLPLQAGVGNVANAVMATLGADPRIPPFYMYTEVLQDSALGLLDEGKLLAASTCALTLSKDKLRCVYDHFDIYRDKLLIRPESISNSPEVVRRLGVIAMNTAIEVDIYGNVNSTNICGSMAMNGIGGSGDFTRNAYISIFMTPSAAKGGSISAVVPFASHVDHNEKSVQVIVTEHGLADLRRVPPRLRPALLIERCAHPDYRPLLRDYVARAEARKGHIPHDLATAFDFHRRYLETGTMKLS